MKEIIVAGIGACGINLSLSYLSLLKQEHDLPDYQKSHENELNVHFNTKDLNSPQARFLFIDKDQFTVDRALANPLIEYVKEDNLFSCQNTSHNLFSGGMYLNEKDEEKEIVNLFRKEIEKCDSLLGIILNHSSIGGTGSGLTSKILQSISSMDLNLLSNTILPPFHPSLKICQENCLGIYNTVLSFTHLIEYCSFSTISDNHALSTLAEFDYHNDLKFDSMNEKNSKMISSLTSGSRFPGIQPASLKKIELNSIPYPRLHFFSGFYFDESRYTTNFIEKSKRNSLNERGGLFSFPLKAQEVKILNGINLYRGEDFSSSELEEASKYFPSFKRYWTEELTGHVGKSSGGSRKDVCHLYSGQFLSGYSSKLSEEFTKYFRRKSFLCWYTSDGMDEMEFTEAESNMSDFASEFMPCVNGDMEIDEE